eukprot:4801541-Heterocapsa_arctica.AAC.1
MSSAVLQKSVGALRSPPRIDCSSWAHWSLSELEDGPWAALSRNPPPWLTWGRAFMLSIQMAAEQPRASGGASLDTASST